MKQIKQLKLVLPLLTRDGTLDLMCDEDVKWYAKNMTERYYSEYSDLKYDKSSIDMYRVISVLQHICNDYKLERESKVEGRMVLKSGQRIIGGCTLHELEEDIFHLSYFVVPKYQHNGVAYRMLYTLIEMLEYSDLLFKGYKAVIRCDNIQSIALIKRLGFNKLCQQHGKIKMNEVYYKGRY